MHLTASVKLNFLTGGNTDIVLPPLGLRSGGPVPGISAWAPTHYADGGHVVFRRPSWSKVPGTGNRDTVPAMLGAGSFVVKKAASERYGDTTMGRLVQMFAAGGNVLTPVAIANVLLGGRLPAGFTGALGGDPELRSVISEATRVIQPLLDSAKTLPRSTTGQNYGDFLQAVLELIVNQRDVASARALLDPIEQNAVSIKGALDNAHRLGVPLTLGLFASGERGGRFAGNRPSSFFELASFLLSAGRTGAPHFAEGGPAGTDSVPAMLTPGEFIFRRPAVEAISRIFGGGFLPALNAMKVPKLDLDAALMPPRPAYMSGGGYVGEAPMRTQPSAAGASRSISVTVNANPGDILSANNVKRFIVPVLEEAMRKSNTR
jgi:hypothetical protein